MYNQCCRKGSGSTFPKITRGVVYGILINMIDFQLGFFKSSGLGKIKPMPSSQLTARINMPALRLDFSSSMTKLTGSFVS